MFGMYFLLQSVQVQAMYNIIQKLTKLNENDGFSYNSAYFDGVRGGNFSDVDKNLSWFDNWDPWNLKMGFMDTMVVSSRSCAVSGTWKGSIIASKDC